MRLGILYNPAAGRGRARRHVGHAERILRDGGAEVTHLESKSREHMMELARQATPDLFDRVVVCGGDGSVHLSLRALDLSVPMAIIPLGSGDDFAKTVGIPSKLEAACQVALGGKVREVDVAEANGLRYAGVASVGFDAMVASYANHVRHLRGSLVYLYSIFRVLPQFEPIPMRITAGDQTTSYDVMFVVIGNTHRYGAGVKIAPTAIVDDGELDMYIVMKCTKWQFLRTLPKGYTGAHVSSPFVKFFRGESFRIETDEPHEVQADGEPLTNTAVNFGIADEKLKVIVPDA